MEVMVEQHRGSAYDVGRAQGVRLSKKVVEQCNHLVNPEFNVEKFRTEVQRYAPHILDELDGLADGLRISSTKASSLFGGYDIPKWSGMGCSSLIQNGYAVRNYDFSPELYDFRLVLLQPKEAFASIGYSLHGLGRHEGVNEKGLFIALHFVGNDAAQKGFTASMIVRIILDRCANTSEALEILKELPHAWDYNFSIGDASSAVVVEAGPHTYHIQQDETGLACTNHFHQKEKNPDFTESSTRLQSLLQRKRTQATAMEMFNWFREPGNPMMYQDYDQYFGTLHTFAYSFDENVILTALPYGEAVAIQWDEWLRGRNLNRTRLIGTIVQSPSQ